MFLIELEVVRGAKLTRHKFTLAEGGKVLVGRLECDLLLEHRSVSRKHLGLAVRKGRLIAGDLKSTSGTRLNGAALNQRVVKKGDVFEVGPYVVRLRRFQAVSRKAPAESFLIPLAGKGAFHPMAIGRFYISFLKRPRSTWKRIPEELIPQDVFRGIPAHALLLVGAALLGARVPLRDAIHFGIWWMVATLALGVGLSQFGGFFLGVRASWGKAMAWTLTASALSVPFALLSTLGGLAVGPTILLSLVPCALSALGFVTLFKPQLRRLLIVSARTAAFAAVVAGSALWIKSRPTEIERSIANLPPAPYEYGSKSDNPLTPTQAGLE